MDRFAASLLIAGICLGRFAAFVLIAVAAVPALATTPPELAGTRPGVPADFSPGAAPRERSERAAYPTDQPRVPVNDALRPPDLLWNPTPASLVKLVPTKVRYRLKF